MIKIENIKVYNIAEAVFSARNAHNSWDKSDSDLEHDILGKNDIELARKLYKAGSEHRKYLRQIFVKMDVHAPLYWWKEMDQYRINVTTDSCSTMHTIHKKEFTLDDFSNEHLGDDSDDTQVWYNEEYPNTEREVLSFIVDALNTYRADFLRTKDKKYWWKMIQLLPSSYNQRRTITMNYENVMNIINQREGHKLDEWRTMVETLRTLPYVKEIRGEA